MSVAQEVSFDHYSIWITFTHLTSESTQQLLLWHDFLNIFTNFVSWGKFEENINVQQQTMYALNNRKKYNLILPNILNITSLASYHVTEQFLYYLSSMKTQSK